MVQLLTVSAPPWLAMPPSFPLAIVSPERLTVWPASTVTIAEENEAPAARSTVRLPAPGPWIAMLLFRSGSGLCRSIVPDTLKPIVNLSEWLPASAVWIAARKLPGPESANEVTVRLTCDGSQRSSNGSSRGRNGEVARRCVALLRGARVDVQLRSQELKRMDVSPFENRSA